MAAFRRDTCCLHAGNTTPYNQNLLWNSRRHKPVPTPFKLTSRRRVDQAGNPIIARPPAPTHLIARQTWPHIFRPASLRFCYPIRIGNLSPHNGNHIGLSRLQNRFRIFGRADMCLRLNLCKAHNRLQSCSMFSAKSISMKGIGNDAGEIEITAGATRHIIHQLSLVMPGNDVLQLLRRLRNLRRRVHVDSKTDDKIFSGHLANTLQHHA